MRLRFKHLGTTLNSLHWTFKQRVKHVYETSLLDKTVFLIVKVLRLLLPVAVINAEELTSVPVHISKGSRNYYKSRYHILPLGKRETN